MFKERTMIFLVVMMATVLVLSGCDNPVQNNTKTKTEPDKIVEHDMWDYFSGGTWELVSSNDDRCFKGHTRTYDKASKTGTMDGPNPCYFPYMGTAKVKFYRKGNIEIHTRITSPQSSGLAVDVIQSHIVKKQGPNRMTMYYITSLTDPPDTLDAFGTGETYQRRF